MQVKPTAMTKFSNYIFKNYAKDSSKLLVHVGAGVAVIGTGAQVGMLMTDKKLEPKKKNFLAKQELMINSTYLALYYTACEAVRHLVNNSIEKGKVLTESCAVAIANLKNNKFIEPAKKWVNIFTKDELKKGISYNLENIENTDFFKKSAFEIQPQIRENSIKALEKFQSFKGGAGVLSVLTASVVAGNIVGVYLGNVIATKMTEENKNN